MRQCPVIRCLRRGTPIYAGNYGIWGESTITLKFGLPLVPKGSNVRHSGTSKRGLVTGCGHPSSNPAVFPVCPYCRIPLALCHTRALSWLQGTLTPRIVRGLCQELKYLNYQNQSTSTDCRTPQCSRVSCPSAVLHPYTYRKSPASRWNVHAM